MSGDEHLPPSELAEVDRGDSSKTPAISARALRAMAVVRWALLAFVTALAAYTVWTFWGPHGEDHGSHEEARYYCPMHPQIRSPDPGVCPICNMNLEPIPEAHQGQASGGAPAPAASSAPPAGPSGVTTITLSEEKQKSVGLASSPVENASLGDRLRVPGVVSAPETGLAQVRVRAPGFVEKVLVRQTGVRVARGQPLAYVYSPDVYRAQEEFLAAKAWSTEPRPERPERGGTADLAAAGRRALELLGLDESDIEQISRTGTPLRAIPVRATAGGFVTRFNAVLGSRADPETVLYEIADLSSVWVIASVHERDMSAIRAGTSAQFIPGGAQQALSGRISLVEPMLEESTRTTRVRLVIPNRDGGLRPGQFGEVAFDLPAASGLFVPRDAVIRTGEHEYAYVAAGSDGFEPRTVKTGMAREGLVQILSGLAAGDRVVTRGGFMLDSESRLQASLAAAPPPPSTSARPSAGDGPSCELDFDRTTNADKYRQCRACEQQHAGMGSMVADCKSAIAKPWR